MAAEYSGESWVDADIRYFKFAGRASHGGAPSHRQINGDITLDNVVFRYRPDLDPVLRHFSLSLRAGEHIGLVGPSGSGKSTVARLLQRLYIAEQGLLILMVTR